MKRVINGKTYSKTIGVKKGELVAFGDNGELNSSGVKPEDVVSFPDGAQSGDVLAWGGETGAEWRPHYPENGNEGDVLTLGETGPEWAPPSGGSPTYIMGITIKSTTLTTFRIRGTVIVSSDTPFTVGEISYADFKSKILKVTSTPSYLPVSNFFGITVNTTGDNAPFEVCSFIRLKNENEVVFTTSSAELTYNLTDSTIRIGAIFEL